METSWSDVNAGLVCMWREYWSLRDSNRLAEANQLRKIIVEATRTIKRQKS